MIFRFVHKQDQVGQFGRLIVDGETKLHKNFLTFGKICPTQWKSKQGGVTIQIPAKTSVKEHTYQTAAPYNLFGVFDCFVADISFLINRTEK